MVTGARWCGNVGERSFFVTPAAIRGDWAEIDGQVAHQIRAVLRLHPGDIVELLDNSGWVHTARLTEVGKGRVAAEVVGRRRAETEPRVRLELYQALLKGQKMELVLQKGTELGIARFVPVLSERCVSRPGTGEMDRKLERWEAIVREASEQSGRAVLPEVARMESFESACRKAVQSDLGLIAWEGERSGGIAGALRSAGLDEAGHQDRPAGAIASGQRPTVALLIGPEGGFTPDEAALAHEAGLRVVGLGPRILRAETAALVAATLVMCRTGDLGG
jgi:16S rRNA (uracil1498-N3)-methyltransferase